MRTIEVKNAQHVRHLWLIGNAVGCTLDVGAGTGWMFRSKDDVIFYDILDPRKQRDAINNPKELEEIQKRYLNYHVGNAESLPYPDSSFDTVVLGDILEHVDDTEKTVDEALRVCAFQVLITVPDETNWKANRLPTWLGYGNPEHKRVFTDESLAELLGQDVEIFRIVGDGWSFLCARLVKVEDGEEEAEPGV